MRQKNHQAELTMREEMAYGEPLRDPLKRVPQMYQKLSSRLLVY